MSLVYMPLWQPWATLVALREKRIETRHWQTAYRGDVAIFATRAWTNECTAAAHLPEFAAALGTGSLGPRTPDESWSGYLRRVLPFGAVIAVAELIDCRPTIDSRNGLWSSPGVFTVHPTLDNPRERAFGNYAPGRFGLVLARVRPLATPVPMKGRQGKLMALPAEIEAQVRSQLEVL